MKWNLIVIEWIDAAGKTTLAQSLSSHLGARYYKTPGGKTQSERDAYDDPSVSVAERFDFYFSACRDDIHIINDILHDWQDVVCDRLLTSTLVHHLSLDPLLDVSKARELDRSLSKTQILLIATRDEVNKRLSHRPHRTRFEEDDDGFMKSQELFLWEKHDQVIATNIYDQAQTLGLSLEFLTRRK